MLGRQRTGDGSEEAAVARGNMARLVEHLASQRYPAEPVRPWMLIASRVALWGAVVVGALGGLVGCLGGRDEPARATAIAPPDPAIVPAQVSSVAELVVREWLTAIQDDEERLARLFVEPPELPLGTAPREVREVRTIRGQLVQPRYWSVVVAAEVAMEVESTDATGDTGGSGPAEAAEGEEDGVVQEVVTWYVDVGIVGNPAEALAALRTPAIVPGPPAVDEGWSYTVEPWEPPQPADELGRTIEGFLTALLAGEGDPGPYLGPNVDIPAAEPAPLVSVVVDEMSVQELDDGRRRVQVRATGLTDAEDEQPLAYEVLVRWRDDRWEVLELFGTSTLTGLPPDVAEAVTAPQTTGAAG